MMATRSDGLVLDSATPQGIPTTKAQLERPLPEGAPEGYGEALLQALTFIYETRLGHMPEVVQTSLQATHDAARLPSLLPVFMRGDAEDIARAVLLN